MGPARYFHDKAQLKNKVGVATGLAWTAIGGTTLQVEVSTMKGTGQLELTGQLGDVMKESAKTAVSCLRTRYQEYKLDPDFYQHLDLHIHLPEGMYALQNDCFAYRGQAVCGARGWVQGNAAQGEKDAKLLRREVGRLRLSLQSAADKGLPIALAMFHFPPFDEKQAPNEITALLHEYGVRRVVYGHLHGKSLQHAFEGTLDGIQYELVSCDHLNFAPKLILP